MFFSAVPVSKMRKKCFFITWHIGLRTALQDCLAQVTGSYWIGGRSVLSFRGVYSVARGTTILRG